MEMKKLFQTFIPETTLCSFTKRCW